MHIHSHITDYSESNSQFVIFESFFLTNPSESIASELHTMAFQRGFY